MAQKGETTTEALHKIKICSGFLIRKAFCKVRVCSEYRVMLRIIRRNSYQEESKFDRAMIAAYRECGLSFHDNRLSHLSTLIHWRANMESMGCWVSFWTSYRVSTPSHGKCRHILRSALENRTTAPWTISQEMGIFAARPFSSRTVCVDICSSVDG